MSLNRYSYDIYGNPTQTEEIIFQPFRYSGELWDNSTGLQYLRARWYDPSVGRFIVQDTYEGDITNPLSLNLYTYVSNNPLKYSDPSGHQQILDPGGTGGLPTPFGGYAGSSSDKGLISALLAMLFPFYFPAPAREPTIIPQDNPMGNDPYISQQGTEFENRAIIIPQNPSIENQPYIDSIPFQDNNMEILTSVPWITFDNIPNGQEKEAIFDTLAHIDAGTIPTDRRVRNWGTTFGNREEFLPTGNYKEYTVNPEPTETNRGMRRIVTEVDTGVMYYTWTHYGTAGDPPFVRIR